MKRVFDNLVHWPDMMEHYIEPMAVGNLERTIYIPEHCIAPMVPDSLGSLVYSLAVFGCRTTGIGNLGLMPYTLALVHYMKLASDNLAH